jgi:hypothetical protein
MPITKPLFTIKGFKGVNNVADSVRIQSSGAAAFLIQGVNLDIDNQGMAHRRDGYESAALAGTSMHSLWSDEHTCLFVDSGDLCRLKEDFTADTLLFGIGNAPVSYVSVAGKVYLTNNQIIGYIDAFTFQAFPDPDETYKVPMFPGHLIEHFGGRLFVAKDNVICFSDAMAPMRTDTRKNFRPFPSRILMMRAVIDGLYISDLKNTYFMPGKNVEESELVRLTDYPAFYGTDAVIDAENVAGMEPGKAILWTSPMGICVGGASGNFRNLTREFYQLQSSTGQHKGASIVLDKDGYHQYLTTMHE